MPKLKTPLTPTQSRGEILESAIKSAFLEIYARGPGTKFSADDLYNIFSRSIPIEQFSGLLARKVGLAFRRWKSLKLCFQSPLAVKSERNKSALIQVWVIGAAPKVQPTI